MSWTVQPGKAVMAWATVDDTGRHKWAQKIVAGAEDAEDAEGCAPRQGERRMRQREWKMNKNTEDEDWRGRLPNMQKTMEDAKDAEGTEGYGS
eukprot:gene14593-biopygen1929